MKRRARSLFFATAAVLSGAGSLHAAIVLNDGSFEQYSIANGGASQGWTVANGWAVNGTYLVNNGVAQNVWFNQPVPDGLQAMSFGGNSSSYISQQLNDSVTGAVMTGSATQQFDITFFAGRRKENTTTGTFTVLLQAFNGSSYVGELARQTYNTGTDDGNAATIDLGLGVGDWTTSAISLSLTAAADQFSGNNIRLVFAQNAPYGGGGEAAIDNVTISAVPEPATYGLLGAGALAGIAFVRRRRMTVKAA